MANVIRRDRGWNRIQLDIAALKDRSVKVGFLAGGPSQDGTPVVDYATWNEFGTESIPSRPFMRRTADQERRSLRTANGQFALLIKQMISRRLNPNQVLNAVGLYYQSKVRETIRTSKSWAVPNSPLTIKMKKSSTPLIDHGILIGAVNYEKSRK
jgi:hypothetical protein